MRYLLTFCAAFVWLLGSASAQSFVSCAGGAKLLYINGVVTPDVKAVLDSADLLATRVSDFGVSCVSEVAYHHNLSQGLAADVLKEAALQKATELGISIAEAILNTVLVWSGRPAPLFPEYVQETVRTQLIAVTQRVSLSSYSFSVNGVIYTTADVVNQVRDTAIAGLQQHSGLVLVGHSQGNFFVNEAYTAIVARTPKTTSDRLAVVNVANASMHAPSGLYVSSKQDKVIFALSVLAFALDPNFEVGNSEEDRLGHGFNAIYLNRTLPDGLGPQRSVAAKVMELVQTALDRIKPTAPAVVVYAQTGTDEAIQLGSPVPGSFRYYFLGYQAAGNPPTQPNYWTASRNFDIVRIRLLGGTGTCDDLGPSIASSSRLVDETGQTIATLVRDAIASGSGYCVFRTIRGGGLAPVVPAGSRIAAVELSPGILSTKTFTLAGSSQNSGRSLFGFAGERAGGFAFQFCSGLCTEPFDSELTIIAKGRIDSVYGSDTLLSIGYGGPINVGDAITYEITFRPNNNPDLAPADPELGAYRSIGGKLSIAGRLIRTFGPEEGSILIYTNFSGTGAVRIGYVSVDRNPMFMNILASIDGDPSVTQIYTDALLLTLPDISSFYRRVLSGYVFLAPDEVAGFIGSMESLMKK